MAAPRSRRSSPRSDRCGGGRDRRQRQLGAAHAEADLLEPAVAERALREGRDRALARVHVELDGRARAFDDDALLAETLRRVARELEAVDFLQHGVVAPGLYPSAERELVHELAQLPGRGADHLDVATRRFLEAALPRERVREPDHGRERRAQVVARQGDETGEGVV